MIGVLVNPKGSTFEPQVDDVRATAQAIGRKIMILNAATEQDIHRAYAEFVRAKVGALLICGDPLFTSQRAQLVTLTTHYAIADDLPDREHRSPAD